MKLKKHDDVGSCQKCNYLSKRYASSVVILRYIRPHNKSSAWPFYLSTILLFSSSTAEGDVVWFDTVSSQTTSDQASFPPAALQLLVLLYAEYSHCSKGFIFSLSVCVNIYFLIFYCHLNSRRLILAICLDLYWEKIISPSWYARFLDDLGSKLLHIVMAQRYYKY